MKETLTTGEIAKYCGVNFRTVIRWIEKGYMKSFKLPGRGDNRVPVSEFIEFLNKNNMPIPDDFKKAKYSTTKQDNDSNKCRVLIIEDEKNMANAMRRALMRGGYDVEVAHNGVVAGMKLISFMPDIVTLDLQMPGMSGFEVLEVMRSNDQYQSVKVLVVSAADKAKIAQVMGLGVDDVLAKPFDNNELLEKVQKLITT